MPSDKIELTESEIDVFQKGIRRHKLSIAILFFMIFMLGIGFHMLIHTHPKIEPAKCEVSTAPAPVPDEPVACVPPHPKSAYDIGARVKYVGTNGVIPLGAEGSIVSLLGHCRDDGTVGFGIQFDIADTDLCILASDIKPL